MRKEFVGRLGQTLAVPSAAFHRNALQQRHRVRAFTLIELLVVMAIIIILAGLLYPAYNAVQNQAKRTQAKNDLTQIVNAVNAYYTEYGTYPVPSGTTADYTYGTPGDATNNALFDELRAVTSALNTRQIVFINPPNVKDDTAGSRRSGVSPTDNQYYDPWGTPYFVEIDGDYNNQITPNPYSDPSPPGPPGGSPLSIGVIGWSWGKDQMLGNNGDSIFTNSDDVISWQ
jgi:prepilin-type N-terminal cleavage/methylation domain-containing protein